MPVGPRAPALASAPLGPALAAAPRVVVRQRRVFLENLTGIEATSRFTVHAPDGTFLAGFAEHGAGAGALLSRWFLKARRPFLIGLYTSERPREPALLLDRPWTWFLSRLEVRTADGRVVGRVRQRLSLLRKRLDVEAPDGRRLARLVGPLLHPWTVVAWAGPEEREEEVARIEKRWAGLLTEAFTDADTFMVALPRGEGPLRPLLLAAAILVDFLWFEHRG
jgi:hypothetical protein